MKGLDGALRRLHPTMMRRVWQFQGRIIQWNLRALINHPSQTRHETGSTFYFHVIGPVTT
jgi:hypothetical protein